MSWVEKVVWHPVTNWSSRPSVVEARGITTSSTLLKPLITIRPSDFYATWISGKLLQSVSNSRRRNFTRITDSCLSEKTTKAIKKDIQEYCIYTNGINILDIRYITGIDLHNTVCNDLVEVYNNFGIEVARTRLMRELYDAYDRAGHAVTYGNLSIIVDMMTSSGVILSIDRHGMSKSDTDVLGRASFEKPDEHLISASVFGEVDLMRGVSSRLSTGLVIKGGTGFCDVALDVNMLENSEYTDDSSKYRQFTEISTDTVANDVLNNPTINSSDIFIPM
jgi:DNA-directed RNA polymerase beta' subunit